MKFYKVWEHGKAPKSAINILAYSADEAANEWADTVDIDAELSIANGKDVRVIVAETHQGAPHQHFLVSGELVPSYNATEIMED